MNLRGRIRRVGICCIPWRQWRGELEPMPVSSKTLFCRKGVPIDILESALLEEGFLFPDEVLLEVLKTEHNLHRVRFGREEFSAEELGEFPDDWTEEDFQYFEGGG